MTPESNKEKVSRYVRSAVRAFFSGMIAFLILIASDGDISRLQNLDIKAVLIGALAAGIGAVLKYVYEKFPEQPSTDAVPVPEKIED